MGSSIRHGPEQDAASHRLACYWDPEAEELFLRTLGARWRRLAGPVVELG